MRIAGDAVSADVARRIKKCAADRPSRFGGEAVTARPVPHDSVCNMTATSEWAAARRSGVSCGPERPSPSADAPSPNSSASPARRCMPT